MYWLMVTKTIVTLKKTVVTKDYWYTLLSKKLKNYISHSKYKTK